MSKLEVVHKDRNKLNNKVENLEWVTSSESKKRRKNKYNKSDSDPDSDSGLDSGLYPDPNPIPK